MSERRYEVAVRRADRWVIDCLTSREAEARARADELYSDESVAGVRIVRGRFAGDGTSFETVIHEQVRPESRKAPPVRIAASPSHDAWCETPSDLYGPASRRVIAGLLRNFLDRFALTPTELLHYHRYIRLLERHDDLLAQALQRTAALQARVRGSDARQRADALNAMITEATRRAREALDSRALPRLSPGGLGELHDAVASLATAPADRAFSVRFAVACALETAGGSIEKFDLVAAWARAVSDRELPLIDELCAGLLGSASVLQATLGPRPHLGAALVGMADLALGRAAETTVPKFAALLPHLAVGRLPETRLVLTERIATELAGGKPLTRDDKGSQRQLFEVLFDKLVDDRGVLAGGNAMVEAVARRSREYGIIGGVEAVRFEAPDPLRRIEQLAGLATKPAGQRQLQAIAGGLMELLDAYAGDRAALVSVRAKIEPTRFAAGTKNALLERLS